MRAGYLPQTLRGFPHTGCAPSPIRGCIAMMAERFPTSIRRYAPCLKGVSRHGPPPAHREEWDAQHAAAGRGLSIRNFQRRVAVLNGWTWHRRGGVKETHNEAWNGTFGFRAGAISMIALAQSSPPSTSGNGVTLVLGLMAFSLIPLLIGVWAWRGLREFLNRRRAPQARGRSGYGTIPHFCTRCGGRLSAESVCRSCQRSSRPTSAPRPAPERVNR